MNNNEQPTECRQVKTGPQRPNDFEEWNGLNGMSNFDHTIDDGFESALRESKVYGYHAALNFCGHVWFANGAFHEDVWRYWCYVKTISAETLEALMEAVNDQYGED